MHRVARCAAVAYLLAADTALRNVFVATSPALAPVVAAVALLHAGSALAVTASPKLVEATMHFSSLLPKRD